MHKKKHGPKLTPFFLFSTTNIVTRHCTPLAVSKRGNLYFPEKSKRLQEYCPETGLVRNVTSDICVISPFVENLLPSRRSDSVPGIRRFGFRESRTSKIFRQIELSISHILQIQLMPIEDVLLITTLWLFYFFGNFSLTFFHYFC